MRLTLWAIYRRAIQLYAINIMGNIQTSNTVICDKHYGQYTDEQYSYMRLTLWAIYRRAIQLYAINIMDNIQTSKVDQDSSKYISSITKNID